jgi:hypothetical protein
MENRFLEKNFLRPILTLFMKLETYPRSSHVGKKHNQKVQDLTFVAGAVNGASARLP